MNYPAVPKAFGTRDQRCHSGLSGIFLCFTVLLCINITPEGFPTSGNDRIRKTLTPMLSFGEFFDEISHMINIIKIISPLLLCLVLSYTYAHADITGYHVVLNGTHKFSQDDNPAYASTAYDDCIGRLSLSPEAGSHRGLSLQVASAGIGFTVRSRNNFRDIEPGNTFRADRRCR